MPEIASPNSNTTRDGTYQDRHSEDQSVRRPRPQEKHVKAGQAGKRALARPWGGERLS